MSDWTGGYVADIGYTFGYYTELNPLRVNLAFLNARLVVPTVGSACELGFGQGVSANIHAAASVATWHGTDFNPSQASFAQELATASGAGAQLFDDAFADFTRRTDLPDFDYIGIHGIWSWISDENRAVIVEFIRRKLKVGGVLYISYNTLPGWAAFAPMRQLMTEHAEIIGAEGHGIVGRINGALDFTERLLATNPTYARANPQVAERMKKIKEQSREYLAHEYFNRDWMPMRFSTMAEWLEPAKLSFACSAHYLDHIDEINLTADQRAFLKGIPDTMFRESVRDFMVNQQFRRDYWVKGPRQMSVIEQADSLRAERVVLVTPRASVSFKFTGSLGEVSMSEAVYGPILDALADHKIRSIADIEAAVKDSDASFAQIVQAVILLVGVGHLAAVQEEALSVKAAERTRRLNTHLLRKALASPDIAYLASSVTGGGVPLGRFQQLFLLALRNGQHQPAEMAEMVWQALARQGQKLVKEGATLETPEQNLAELTRQAQEFCDTRLPILKALQVA